jgi:hypothetical protein
VKAQNLAGYGAASSPSNTVTVPPVSIARGTLLIGTGSFTRNYTFMLPEAAAALTEDLTLIISDLSGRMVWRKTIRPSEGKVREISWDGTTLTGTRAPSGMYLVRVRTTSRGAVQEAIQKGVRLRQD